MLRTVTTHVAVVLLAIAAGVTDARAFHDLDCGPLRAKLADGPGGKTRCSPISPEVQEQYLRSRELVQEQERRVRELELQQRQRAKAQELRGRQEAERQRQFTLRHTTRSKQPGIDNAQSILRHEILNRQAQEKAERDRAFRESDLEMQTRLLQQQIELLKSELESDQRVFERFLEKDQDKRR